MNQAPCPRCNDDGFITRPGPRFAEAVVCRHLQNCSSCGGTGREVVRTETGEQVLKACGCGLLALAHRVKLYNKAKIPALFHCSKISDFRCQTASQRVTRAYFEGIRNRFEPGHKGAALFGTPGVGKTHLMTAVAGWMTLTRGIEVRYADFSDLIVELKAGYDRGHGEAHVLGPVTAVPVLMIDELGKGRGSEWERGVIDNIISHRYNAGLSTFFATNYLNEAPEKTPGIGANANAPFQESLRSRLGPRVWSRLQAMCTLMELYGPDARAPRTPQYQSPPTVAAPRGVQRVTPRR